MSLRIGDLDRQITIETNTPVQDETGDPVEGWSSVATVWAKIEKGRGRQRFVEEHELNSSALVFKIRYRTDFTVEDRVVYDSDNYDIKAVDEIGRGEGLFVAAEKSGE